MKIETWPLLLALLNALAFAGVVVVNALANALAINGKTTGALSDAYPNLFVPAGFTFSIWGVIYLLLALYVVYGVVVVLRGGDAGVAAIRAVDIFFLLSCVANIGWIFAWHYERVGWSLVLMLFLLGTLLAIYFRLGIGLGDSTRSVIAMVRVPFSVYLGWITVATIANVTALLVDVGWNGFGLPDAFWAGAMIVVATLVASLAIVRRGDGAFSLVVIWAFAGIAAKRFAAAGTGIHSAAASSRVVAFTAVAGALIVLGFLLFGSIRRYVP